MSVLRRHRGGSIAREILETLNRIESTMFTQADADTLTAALTADDAEILLAVNTVQGGVTDALAEIAELQQANPDIDTSKLQAIVAQIGNDAGAVTTAAASVAAIVPTPDVPPVEEPTTEPAAWTPPPVLATPDPAPAPVTPDPAGEAWTPPAPPADTTTAADADKAIGTDGTPVAL